MDGGNTRIEHSLDIASVFCYNQDEFKTWVLSALLHASQQRPRVLMVGFFVGMGQSGGIMDYSEMKKAQLIEEIEALQEGLAELERAQAERKRAENEIRLREQQLSLIYDSIGDILYYLKVEPGPHYRFLTVNSAFLKATGLTVEQIVGKTINEVIPEPSLQLVRSNYEKAIREKRIVYWEETSQYLAGLKTGIVSIAPVFDDKGNCTRLVGLVHDITERKRAEEVLRESEERYRDLYENAPNAYFAVGADGLIRRCNRRVEELLGCAVEELVGRPVFELYADTPQGKGKASKVFQRFRAGETVTDEELQMQKADGTPMWISLTVNAVRDAQGQVVESRSIVVDITERKRAEEEIGKLAKFPSENPNPVLRVAKDGTVIYANEAALPLLNVWGCQMDQTLPDDWRQLTSDVLSSGSSEDAVVECERRILSLTFAPVVDADYVNVYGLDITERKRAEEELRQSYVQLQRTLEGTVNALVSTIEIRDPYTAGHQRQVTQLACAIAEEMGFPEEQIEGLRMAGLIHDIGKISIPAEILSKPVQLNELEWGMIKAHPQVGYDILKTTDFPWPVAQIVLQHHERMDGSGYPRGLSGEAIILEARILGVADVVEAMASFRPYRPARGLDKALEEISQNRGVLYDSQVADACLKLFAEKGLTFE